MENEIKEAYNVLIKGGVILYPTDTIWGIGCDATNKSAVKKIYEIKKRINSKALLVLIDSVDQLEYYVDEVPAIAYDLIDLSEKPLTIIYSNAKNVTSELIAPDGTLGIRVTKEIFSMNLCRKLKRPLVSTSANISGERSPANFSEIDHKIINAVDYVVKYRQDEKESIKASGILRLDQGGLIKIIRE